MIKHIQASQIQEALAQRVPRREKDLRAMPQLDPDVDVQVAFGDLIGQALVASETTGNAVERAKALIAAGELDSPARIREAATHMLDAGL
ncbi:MAG: hypothetical protein IIC50_03340 [Planctomycetes bacterium]|nr:hypothetical protein [Planctomycetota bacterium]